MPELPNIEYFKKKAKVLLGKIIQKVNVRDKRFVRVNEKKLKELLEGHEITEIDRIGKNLFFKFDNNYLLLHFGMTGKVEFGEEEPRNTVLSLKLKKGKIFAVTSRRKLGKIELVDIKEIKNKLGPDALKISKAEFFNMIKEKNISIKLILMDQEKIAGLGNVYTDEILYHSGINPTKKSFELDKDKINELYEKMKRVLKIAIKLNGDLQSMPEDYLIIRRKEDKLCGICVGRIERVEMGGRSTYFCNVHQR